MRTTTPTLLAGLCLLALACSGGSGDEVATDGSAASLVIPSATEPPQGSWTYGEDCGDNAGGIPVSISYTVRITGNEVAINADGYQTMLRVIGTTSVSADGLWSARFERNGEEALGDGYLKPGDVMLTFTVEDGDLQITPGELIFNCTETTLFTREG